MWRKTAADILLTISRHSLNQPVVSYLHGRWNMSLLYIHVKRSLPSIFFTKCFSYLAKGCLSLCLENMNKNSKASPLETVEMFVTVFCFLKDSSQSTETLQEDFRTCQGYIFLSEFLLRLVIVTSKILFQIQHLSVHPSVISSVQNSVTLLSFMLFHCRRGNRQYPLATGAF